MVCVAPLIRNLDTESSPVGAVGWVEGHGGVTHGYGFLRGLHKDILGLDCGNGYTVL